MMPIDPIAVLNRLQELYAGYPGAFQGTGIALSILCLYFAVIEIATRVAK